MVSVNQDPSYIADAIRAGLPTFGIVEPAGIVALKPKSAQPEV